MANGMGKSFVQAGEEVVSPQYPITFRLHLKLRYLPHLSPPCLGADILLTPESSGVLFVDVEHATPQDTPTGNTPRPIRRISYPLHLNPRPSRGF